MRQDGNLLTGRCHGYNHHWVWSAPQVEIGASYKRQKMVGEPSMLADSTGSPLGRLVCTNYLDK